MAKPSRRQELSFDILKPLLRAYALGYISVTGPRLLSLVKVVQRRDQRWKQTLQKIFFGPLAFNRFPAFCGLLVGGSTIFQLPVRRLLTLFTSLARGTTWSMSRTVRERLVRFFAAFISAWLSFQLLNHGKSERIQTIQGASFDEHARTRADSETLIGPEEIPKPNQQSFVIAGKTMDLTLFGVTRALDICIGEAWTRHKIRRKAALKWSRSEVVISQLADAGIFAFSASVVMWAWFYLPERLPHAYNKWIGEAAQVDNRLIEALRQARRGEWVYGRDTGKAKILSSMCEDYGWPVDWGDPAKTIPIPCEMVHMGTGRSCEKHAISRFLRAFRFAMATYLPLQLAIRSRAPSTSNAIQGLKEAARSSAFLGSFVSLFYYGVCLSRTRLGPRVLGHERVTPMMWDSGLCVAAGCMMCGWSILLEKSRRRQEIAFFVAPRAAATILPRRYEEKYQIREKTAFALSAAVIFACVQEKPERVRGVLGRLLTGVLS